MSTQKDIVRRITVAATFAFLSATASAWAQKPSLALTATETEHFRYMAERTKKKVVYKLNLAEPHQYGYVLAMMRLGGASPEKQPNFFRRLELARKAARAAPPTALNARGAAEGDPPCPSGDLCLNPINFLQYATLDPAQKNLFSSMLSSNPGGTQSTSMQMNYRVGSGTPFAISQVYWQYAGGTNFSQQYSAALPTGTQAKSVIASALFTLNTSNGMNVYSAADDDTPVYATSVCSTAPNYGSQQPPGTACPAVGATCVNSGQITTPIVSCYGRTGSDCNYVWGGVPYPQYMPLTISGSMVFPAPLALTGGAPTGTYTLNIYYPAGNNGGGCYLYPNGQQGGSGTINATNFTVTGTNQLNFCFQGTQFVNSSCLLSAGNITNLNLTVNPYLTVQSGSNYGLGYVSSNSAQYTGQTWFALAPQIKMFQGCFAKGTRILLADGSWKPIEEFKADGSEEVISANGKTRKVIDRIIGPEKHPMYRITDSEGKSVELTRFHPVPTSESVKFAFQLREGDVVTTQKGPSMLTSVKEIPSTGTVYNLALAGDETSTANAEMTLVADGIFAGDSNMQQYFTLKASEHGYSKEDTLRLLDKEWHQDYLNSLKEK